MKFVSTKKMCEKFRKKYNCVPQGYTERKNKSMGLVKIHNAVLEILQDKPKTRSDDMLLWLEVIKKTTCLGVVYAMQEPFEEIITRHKYYALPPFESVSRTRRKIQRQHPELKDKETARHRKNKELEYKEYARD